MCGGRSLAELKSYLKVESLFRVLDSCELLKAVGEWEPLNTEQAELRILKTRQVQVSEYNVKLHIQTRLNKNLSFTRSRINYIFAGKTENLPFLFHFAGKCS